ncbi:MAG: NACHT domain-containing protein [Casimicrobium sp.]
MLEMLPPELLPYARSAVKAVAPFLLEKIKKTVSSAASSTHHALFNAFSKYTEQTYSRHSFFVSIALPNQQNQLRDFYVPLTLNCSHGGTNESHTVAAFPKQLIDEKKDLLIVDSAGMGKSTLLKFMFLGAVDTAPAIPIFVELRKLTKSVGLLDHICNELKELDGSLDRELVVRLLESGDFLIFLDGYDEIPDEDRGAVTTLIVDFKRRANKNNFAISSRDLPELTSFADFFRLTIQPLAFQEATLLISKYGAGSARTQTLIERLRDPQNDAIKEFLGNPLLVSLLFKAYDYKPTLPLKKHIFYRQVYEALFENHDLSKEEGGFERRKKTGLTIYDFELVVRSLGFVTLQTSKVEYSKDHLLQLVADAKSHVPTIQFDPQNLLKDLSTNVPLFTVDGTLWRWSHKSLQEYFAALYVSAQGKDFQRQVLRSMYESPKAPNYVNFLTLFADIEPKGFRHILVRAIVADLIADYASFPRELAGVASDDLHERWRLTTLRELVKVQLSEEKFKAEIEDSESPSDAHALAIQCLADKGLSFSRSYSTVQNPTIVVVSDTKIHLIMELFKSGALEQYANAKLPRTLGVRSRGALSDNSWLTVLPDERAILHQRGVPNAELNNAKIFVKVNDYLRRRDSSVPVNPETLSAQLAEIDAEIQRDENSMLKF